MRSAGRTNATPTNRWTTWRSFWPCRGARRSRWMPAASRISPARWRSSPPAAGWSSRSRRISPGMSIIFRSSGRGRIRWTSGCGVRTRPWSSVLPFRRAAGRSLWRWPIWRWRSRTAGPGCFSAAAPICWGDCIPRRFRRHPAMRWSRRSPAFWTPRRGSGPRRRRWRRFLGWPPGSFCIGLGRPPGSRWRSGCENGVSPPRGVCSVKASRWAASPSSLATPTPTTSPACSKPWLEPRLRRSEGAPWRRGCMCGKRPPSPQFWGDRTGRRP